MRSLSIVLLLIAGCLATCNRVQRMDEPTAEQAEHRRLQAAELPHCLARLAAIRAELAALGPHPWAGEYSWRHHDTCANSLEGEGIALAPASGAVWWYRGDGPEHRLPCDHGDIISIDADSIRVHWAIASHSAHESDEPEHVRLLDETLVRLQWGSAELLVPACRMPAFCGGVSSGVGGPRIWVPRRGGWVTSYSDDDLMQQPPGDWPQVPEEWKGYLVHEPIRALAVAKNPATIIGAYGPRPWKEDATRLWAFRARIDKGSDQRVLPGMRFFAEHPVDAPRSELRMAQVIHVEEDSALIEFRGWSFRGTGVPAPTRGLNVSTRDPRMR